MHPDKDSECSHTNADHQATIVTQADTVMAESLTSYFASVTANK